MKKGNNQAKMPPKKVKIVPGTPEILPSKTTIPE
jgi:hypothetical protein